MTENERIARQRAFEEGQSDARAGKHFNRFPDISPDHDQYEQGHQVETETIFD